MKKPIHVFNFKIENKADGEVDIFIDGDIVDAETQAIWKLWFGDDTSTSYKSFREQLNAVEASVYNVYINSGGGIVTDAMAIHDLLIDMQGKGKAVNTRGRGIIGSAATYILMAGKNCEMSKNSWFMIHNVGGGVYGDVNDIERYATTLRKFNDASRDFYSRATGLRKEDITKMMNEETWMTADEAKNKGFVKQISGEATFTQAISKDNWPFSNMTVLNSYNSAVKPPAQEENSNSITQKFDEMKKFFQDLSTSIMNAIKTVKAPENNDHSTLMNSIGEAITKPMNDAAEKMDVVVNDAVKAELASKPVNDAIALQVKNAVDAATDFTKEGPAKVAFDNAVAAAVKAHVENSAKAEGEIGKAVNTLVAAEVKKSVENLEKDITQLKGKKSESVKNETEALKPVGSFGE